MRIFEANLRALRARNPTCAAAVEAAGPLTGAVEPTAAGDPTVAAGGVLLHSRHEPRREAARWAAAQEERLRAEQAATALVLGFGLGYHVEALAASWPGRLLVAEPDVSLLRAALAARDLRPLLARIELVVAPPADEALAELGRIVVLAHAPSVLREGDALRTLGERVTARAALRELRLRVLVVSPLSGGSYPITGYCARALAELGHAVTLLDLAPFAGAAEALSAFSPRRLARRGIEEAFARFLGAGVLAAVDAARPDLVLVMAQAPLLPEVLAEIGRRGALRAFWFVEDHRLFAYWREIIAECDYFFAIQQGDFLAEAGRLCSGAVRYLPCAADPAIHRPLVLTASEGAELGAPVGFVGAGYRNRRIAFRSLLDLGLRLWGSDWAGSGPVEAAVERGGARVTPEESVRIFNATDVNLNLHSSTYVDGVDPRGDFVNPRTFELAAAGAFQLVDERALLPALFRPGAELATFGDTAELRDLVRHYLAHPAERAALAAAARARALAEHTYRHRMETLLETVCGRETERLRARAREETVGDAARAEGDSPLGRLLAQLPQATPFTLDGVVGGLLGRRGDYSEAEQVLLFIHQFDELYVREHRQ
jgi:spore maturation protein CgeB